MALVLRNPVHSGGGLIFAGQEELSGTAYEFNSQYVTLIVAPLNATMTYTAGQNIQGQTTVTLAVQASMIFASGNQITGQTVIALAVQASMSYVEDAPEGILSGGTTVSVTPSACNLYYLPFVSGHMTAGGIITRISRALSDPSNRRWSANTLYDYITDAERQICILIPEAYVVTEVVKLDPGTRQTIPNDAHRMIGIIRNMGDDGETPGSAVTYAEKADMDRFNPNWHADPTAEAIDEYIYDGLDPNVWYNYPPIPDCPAVFVEGRFAKIPPAITESTQNLSVKAIYTPAVFEYGMYRALSRNSEDADPARAAIHEGNFYRILGIKPVSDVRTAPRTNAPPVAKNKR